MQKFLLALGIGIVAVSKFPILPGLILMLALVVTALILYRFWKIQLVTGLLVGIVYGSLWGHIWLARNLPVGFENQPILIEGYVASLPRSTGRSSRFIFDVVKSIPDTAVQKVSLAWYQQPGRVAPAAGEKWRLKVKLVRPHGLVNPGLFDYEAWLISQGIHGTGYVVKHKDNLRLETAGWGASHQVFRQAVMASLDRYFAHQTGLLHQETRGLLVALLIGESTSISPTMWQILSDTGTNHLLIISGLHVGLVAGFLFAVTGWLFRGSAAYRQPLTLCTTLLGIFAYSLIVGFGLPVQRALIMTSVGLIALALRRQVSTPLILLLAFDAVLLANPFAGLNAGFWLSFGVVLALILVFGGSSDVTRRKIISLVSTQWVAFVAIAPLLICWVFQFSFASLLVNLIAIPFVSVILVPLMLLLLLVSGFSLPFEAPLLDLVMMLLGVMQRVLAYFAELDLVFRHSESDMLLLFLALVGSGLILLPRGFSIRWLGLLCWLPVMAPAELLDDRVKINILDVGQGLSVVVNQGNSSLVYDAGPAYGRFDAGEQIVFPALKRIRQEDVDLLVISHNDLDHAGGTGGLKRRIKIRKTLSSDPAIGEDCNQGQTTQVGAIKVRSIPGIAGDNDNNLSCVILVETAFGNLLLPGDIEASVEAMLLQYPLPTIDVMLAPHHGSRSSSTPAFINHVNPGLVVFSTGYQNRFGHPDAIVADRYRNRGILTLNTAETGAIYIQLSANGMEVQRARNAFSRFWYD